MIVGDGAWPGPVNIAGWAIGDGVADDTEFIARAIDVAGPGGSVFFGGRDKQYLTSGITPLPGQRLYGQATLRLTAGSPSRLIDINGVGGVTIEGLTLDVDGVARDGIRVAGSEAVDTRLIDLHVRNATGNDMSGINVTSTASGTVIDRCVVSSCFWGILLNSGAEDTHISNCAVRDCTATSVSQGALYLPNCVRVGVVNTEVTGNASNGTYLSTAASDISFTGCHFNGNGNGTTDHRGASINGATRVSFTGCHAEGNQECGFYVAANSTDVAFSACHAKGNNLALRPGGHGFETNGTNTTYAGCIASGQLGDGANEGNGFSINGTGATLSGCISRNNWSVGFRVTGATSATLTGCSATDNSQRGIGMHDGIELSVSSTDITVAGCVCRDGQATKSQRYGIAVSGTVDWYTLTGNILRGNATAGLSDTGLPNKTVTGNLS